MKPTVEGHDCPECGQFVKLYERQISAPMAALLLRLFKLDRKSPDQFFHVSEITPGDFAKLRYWGLITMQANTEAFKRCSGYWAITDRGRQFAKGKLGVPKYALVYNQDFYGYEGGLVNIHACLDKHFDYSELMALE